MVEASWKSELMATMAAAAACLFALAKACPTMAVPAAVAEHCLGRLTEVCAHEEDAEQQPLTHELRVQAIQTLAEIGRCVSPACGARAAHSGQQWCC